MRSLSGFFLVLSLVLPGMAQVDGRITGSVTDASGAVVPGAEVDLFLAGGQKPIFTTKTSGDGLYHFLGVRPGYYDLSVDSQGFVKTTLRNLVIDPARETSVPEIKLQLATVSQAVDVSAEVQGVETSNAEITQTISAEEMVNLPLLDRDPLGIMQTQPGVVYNGNSTTVINGLRTSYSDMTLDGINIQDNYIRDNALDYTPNKILMSQVRQVTMVTSNGNASMSGGATETAFTTPSGTNSLHGELFWDNRNNAFSANDWFNNQAGVGLPFLNQNQFGASIGGPIRKDKLFFYTTYEGVRAHQQVPANTQILTASARAGIFSYVNSSGVLKTVNLLTLRGISIDPVMAKLLAQVPGAQFINNSLIGDGLNTGGYLFNQRANETRDNYTWRLDYNFNTQHQLSASFSWNRDNSDRPDAENDYSLVPKSYNPTGAELVAVSWRWTPSARLTNEFRGGFNLTNGFFQNSQSFGGSLISGTLFSDPVNEFMPQGRNTNTYSVRDEAAYEKGAHYIQFGFQAQKIYVRSYDYAGTVPVYSLGMGVGEPALQTRELPGISATDLATADALLATLGGYLDGYSQVFNVTSRTSGFVPGAPFLRHFRLPDYAVFVADKWRVNPRLTLTLGLRYNLPGVVSERDGLEIQPVFGGNAVQTLLSNATLDFVGSGSNASWYRRDKKDFAPNLGLAWDVFGNGKTSLRAGYSIFYVNDQAIVAPENMLEANNGLQANPAGTGLTARTGQGLPAIDQPVFKVPITAAENYDANPFSVIGSVDPNLHRPYVQQYSIGIEHEVKNSVISVRYVGNHTVGAYRAFDFNQVNVNAGGFLQDFIKAESNGFLAQARTGTFNPAYNAAIPGSQQLTVFPKLSGGGLLSNPDIRFYIQTGQAAELATVYQTNGFNPTNSIPFFANPVAIAADMLTNYSSASYNSLQAQIRHRTRSGLNVQLNYTFSKVLSDADGDSQTRFQNFLDVHNPGIERSRANFDLTHMIKASGFYELPLGKNHALHVKHLDRLLSDWVVSGNMTMQSGAPFSILSQYGTLNRAARSYYNTANTSLQGSALFDLVSFRMTGNGPMIVPSSAINPNDGSGVSAPGDAPFAGQVFFNPDAGQIGSLQRRLFDGPWDFFLDASIKKGIAITERHKVELRMQAFNLLNHPSFWVGDQSINSPTFGVVASTFGSRVVEFGANYHF